MLDIDICKKITNLVEQLSTSGKDVVDKKEFRGLAANAGQSQDYIKFTLEKLLHQLERKHSEIRYGAFLVIDMLFMKSEVFRELLLDEFHVFLELTVESNPEKLLPPPVPAAKKLKQKVLQSIHKWYSKFQQAHKRLALSYNFLKHSLKVDFDDALKRNAFELQRDMMEQTRQSKAVEKRVNSLKIEMEEKVEEISRIVTEMNSCFGLLVPKPNDIFQDEGHKETEPTDEDNDEIDLREHGIVDPRTVISIQLSDAPHRLKVTDDNSAIVESLRDHYNELKNGFMPTIKKWVQVASKADDSALFKKVMDIKDLVAEEMKRFEELSLVDNQAAPDSSDEVSDSDFEDVPDKDGFEDFVVAPPVLAPKSQTSSVSQNDAVPSSSQTVEPGTRVATAWRPWNETEDDANDPASLSATLMSLKTKQEPKPSTSKISASLDSDCDLKSIKPRPSENEPTEVSRKQRLLQSAPKLPFDVDLYHWEDEKLTAPSIEIVEKDGHKFWTPSQDRAGEVFEDPNGIASLRTRVIEFTGSFEPVKWSCRAPLPSGRLCPRKDRFKCPLHGKIVARDDSGNPVRPEDIAELEAEKARAEEEKPPDWQDPEYLKDIEAQTGMDLTIRRPTRGKKKKSFGEMYPGLTDVDKKKNTPRSRLEKKVLNKTSLKRVASTLDSLSHKKFKDKFGDQWNYSMNDD